MDSYYEIVSRIDADTCGYCKVRNASIVRGSNIQFIPPFQSCENENGCRCVVIPFDENGCRKRDE